MASIITAQEPKLYIGLDIHKASWKVHFCTDLFDGSTLSFAPSSEALRKHVNRHYPKHAIRCVYEAGCCGYTAARSFEGYGWQTTVVNPSDVPTSAKHKAVKTDKTDCINLAKQLRQGTLRRVYIPEPMQEEMRSLFRRRLTLVKELRRNKGHIKSLMLYYGKPIPEQYDNNNWSHDFINWLIDVEWLSEEGQQTMDSLIYHYRFIEEEIRRVSNSIRAWCRAHRKKDYDLLRSIPGIGPLVASALLIELGDLRRFTSFKQFAGYIGMAPGVHQSGDSSRTRGLTVRRHKVLRSYIIESAWVAVRKDPVLQTYYRKHAGRNSKNVIVKVARKLLSRVLAVIKTEVPYQIGVIQ